MTAPRPGRAVRGSATGRPLMAALDLLGRRWALRILWELTDGPRGARELRQRCDAMSPSVLYQRLAELTDAQLLSQDADSRYRLTPWDKRWAPRSHRSISGRRPGHARQPSHRNRHDRHRGRHHAHGAQEPRPSQMRAAAATHTGPPAGSVRQVRTGRNGVPGKAAVFPAGDLPGRRPAAADWQNRRTSTR